MLVPCFFRCVRPSFCLWYHGPVSQRSLCVKMRGGPPAENALYCSPIDVSYDLLLNGMDYACHYRR